MTPREPDRFDKQGDELARKWVEWPLARHAAEALAAALRAAESSALERAAEVCGGRAWKEVQPAAANALFAAAAHIRALIPPAAPPAADRLATPACPGPDCKACNGEACGLCGAGCWSHVSTCEHDVVDRHRDLPAPAADYDPISAPIPAGDMNGPHGPLPADETRKAQGAEELSEYEQVTRLAAAMREADRAFEQVGGSTRHHVRDCLLPVLEKHGLRLVAARAAPPEE